LPRDQESAVVDEVESHTGLVIMSSIDTYQFSHLSIQEYLTAHYLVRRPDIESAIKFFRKTPAPTALAVCLSSDPNAYFSQFIFSLRDLGLISETRQQIVSFIRRIVIEGPQFSVSANLGAAILLLGEALQTDISSQLLDFAYAEFRILVSTKSVESSVTAVLHFYVRQKHKNHTDLVLRRPTQGAVPRYGARLILSSTFCELIHI
jgi:hypothetical protein